MWTSAKHKYRDTDGNYLTLEVDDQGGIILQAKEGVFFVDESELLTFVEQLKNKSDLLFTEEE